jgi:hypothetical protein
MPLHPGSRGTWPAILPGYRRPARGRHARSRQDEGNHAALRIDPRAALVNGERDADASSIEQISRQDVVGLAHTMEQPMTRLNILTAGLLAATLATP